MKIFQIVWSNVKFSMLKRNTDRLLELKGELYKMFFQTLFTMSLLLLILIYRNSHQRVFFRKGALQNFTTSKKKPHLHRSLILIKLQVYSLTVTLTQTDCFTEYLLVTGCILSIFSPIFFSYIAYTAVWKIC